MSRKTRKNKHTGSGNKALAILIGTTCGMAAAPNSFAGPTGGVVTSGQGTVSTPSSTSTVIDQSSSRLSLDWQTFDVASNESVRFNQPSSTAIAVNRILDQKPSEVYGRIDANGRVVLVNPNGMLFGRNAQINVGSLLATSLDVVSFDETTGRLNLAAAGAPGAITNDGSITAAAGGSVSLVGGVVANNGLIVADVGSVNLAAGRSATLDFYGGGLLRFETDSALTGNAGGAAAGVSNTGEIYADGGQVLLTTSAARNVFDRAINNEGVVRANRIDNSGGSIRLVGAGGTVVSSGVLDASGTGNGTGGDVQVLGENVGLFGSALIDVSGNNGGGTALIGGDYQGANADVLNANRTIVNPDAQVRADARVSGDGGKVIFWSEDATQFYGTVSARGGATSGNGGFMEASSHGELDFNGAVDLGAAAGQGGNLLLDPDNITINTGSAVAGDIDFDDAPVPGTATVSAASVSAFLNGTGSLTLQANDNITVGANIAAGGAPAGRNLTMQAGENITINNGVTISTSGNITLRANDATATGTESGNGAVIFSNSASAVTSTGAAVSIQGASVQLGDVTAATAVTVQSDTGAITQLVGTDVSGIGVNVTAAGDLTLAGVDANGGTATLTSTNGRILDDDAGTAGGTVIQGANVVLTAGTAIGEVDNLRAGTGSSIDIDTNGNLTASVGSNGGEINLNFVNGLPSLGAGDIVLGATQAGGATGTVLLQSPDDFDTSALAGLVSLGVGNTASGGLRSDGDLTLPTATASVFDVTPNTLALRGDIITDGDVVLDFDVNDLIFDSDAQNGSPILNGDIGRLTALIGEGNNLTVAVDGPINLADVETDGDINVTAGSVGTPGTITVGDVNAVTGDVTLNATNGGAIADDLDGGGLTTIQGSQLSLTGTSIGADVANGEIDTAVDNFTINATGGDVVIVEADSAGINTFAATGGNLTRIETLNGSMSLNTDLNPTTGDVVFIMRGNVNLDFSDRVIGRQGGTGNTTIRSGNNLEVGEVVGDNITLDAGFARTSTGSLTINTGNLATEIVRATNNVTLLSDGTITQANGGGDVVPSVTGNLLTIVAGGNVNLDVNASSLNAAVSGVGNDLTIRDTSGSLTVNNAQATDVVDVRTLAGTMDNVVASGATVSLNSATSLSLQTVSSGGAVNLTANGAINTVNASSLVSGGTLTLSGTPTSANLNTNVTTLVGNTIAGDLTINETNGIVVNTTTVSGGNDVNISANGALTLGAVSAGTGTATLQATGGAITNAGNTLVAGGGLTITGAGSVNLATDVGTLNAVAVTGALTVNEATGSLTVNAATAGGLVSLSTTNGTLDNVTATGNGVTLTAGGANNGMTLTSVNANAGTATLSAGTAGGRGAISGPGISLAAGTLNITSALSVDLDVNAGTLTAANVTNGLTIDDQSGNLMVQGVTAGGAVSISTVGAIQDQDAGTAAGNTIAGSSVSLTAGTGIGTVSDAELTTAAGSSVDVDTTGILTATVLNATGGEINLNLTNAPALGSAITLGSGVGRDGNVLLQSAGGLNLNNLPAGFIGIGDNNSVGVGYSSGGTLRLRDTGMLTDFAPTDLLVRGADIYQGAGTTRTLDLAATGTLTFISSAPAAGDPYRLNTDVGTLNATVNNGIALTVVEANGITLGTISAQSFDLQANGAISDDGLEGSAITAQTATLTATGAIGSTIGDGELDVVIDAGGTLNATAGTGDVAIRSTGNGAMTVNLAAGTAAADDGNVSLDAAGNLTVALLAAQQDDVSVTTSGSVTGTGTVVLADQLTFANASSVDLDTDINTLTANNISGNFRIDETSGPLTVNSVTSTAGNVELNVAGGALTLGTVNANGTATLNASGAITDASGATASVVATQLIVANAGSVDLDTNVGTLNASNVAGTLSVREQSGSLAVTNAAATGAVTVSTVAGSLTGVTASGSGVTLVAGGAASDLSLTQVNAGAGNVTLTAGNGGAITDGAGTSVSGSALTITGAGSVDLNTDVATLAASGIGGALAINDANALQVTSVSSDGVSLTAGGTGNALTLGTVNAGSGAATLSASGGAISNGANTLVATGGLTISSAGSVDLRTDVNTLNVTSNVTGPLSVAEQAGSLNVTNATATGAVTLATVGGALTLGTVTGSGVALTAGGAGSALTIGTVSAGTGTATLTAGGAVTDAANGATSLTAGAATITAASIGVQETTTTAENTLNTSIDTLTATASSGDIVVRDLNDITLASINGATGQDVIVVAPGDITVAQITGAGPNGAGRVLLSAGSDILASGAADHITAGNVELRAGGLDPDGGRIGEAANELRLLVPAEIGGGANGTGANVPSVLVLQRPAVGDSTVAAQVPNFRVVPNPFEVAQGLLEPGNQDVDDYLTTVFTVRTLNVDGSVELANANLQLGGNAEVVFDPNAQNSLLDLSNATNAQGEGTLYIDWASFDPNVSLFGTVNPPICLPRDQQEEDDATDAPVAANATSSGCATTTAQFNGTFRAPQMRLVITSRGLEWVPVRASLLSSLPTIAQVR
jgi:filamentous hemagglutinin family protein